MKFHKIALGVLCLLVMPLAQAMYFDGESGLSENGYRSYRAPDGRYLQPDPIGLSGGSNRRVYGENNPLIFADPTGLNPAAWALRGGLTGAEAGSPFGPVGTIAGGIIGAGTGAWIGWQVVDALARPDPMQSTGLPPGFWPADKGAEEWGRRNGVGSDEGRRRFHGVKQNCPGSRATDVFGVNPGTGDVVDPRGEDVGNLNEGKSK